MLGLVVLRRLLLLEVEVEEEEEDYHTMSYIPSVLLIKKGGSFRCIAGLRRRCWGFCLMRGLRLRLMIRPTIRY